MRSSTRRRARIAGIASVLFFAALLSLSPAHADGAAEQPLSLAEVLDRLKRENLTLLASRHRLSQARAEVVAAGVWSNPNVSANGLLLTHGAVTGGTTELVVSVDQVVPVAGQVGLRVDVAKAELTAEERAFAATAWQLVSDAKVAYLELQRAEARARAVRSGLVDLGRVEAIVTERTAAGAGSAYDRVRVAAERSKLEARRAQADVDVTSARAALAEAVGKSVDVRSVTASEPIAEPPDPPRDVEALVQRAIATRADVGSVRARADAEELRVSYVRRQYVPSPDLSVGYGRYFDVAGSNGASGGALLVGVSLPIPLLDRGQGRIERGIAAAAQARAQRDAAELAVRRQVEQAALSVPIRVDAWRQFRDTTARDLARMRAIAELSYREGRASILELLDAYATFLDGEERSIDLRAAAARSVIDLERAIGSGR
jgi:cobalt-zinc-cadmium efflux system outer membrane protein